MRLREKTAASFNDKAAEKIQACKRINLKAGRRTKGSHQGCVGSGQALRNFIFFSSAPVISARKQDLSMKLSSMIDISGFYCQNKFELD